MNNGLQSAWNKSWLVNCTRCQGGDPPAPTPSESTAQMLYAYTQGLPDYAKVSNAEILPNELAQLNAAKTVGPGWADLASQIYGQYAPGMNKIGADIAGQNALAQAQSDLAVYKGFGPDIAKQSLEIAKINDPEYFKTREAMSNNLGQMLTGQLTGGEEAAIDRGIARNNANMGVGDRTSIAQSAKNATLYGNAVNDRMTQALGLATQALPSFKSGVDTGSQVLGRPTQTNTGDSRVPTFGQGQLGQQSQSANQGLIGQIGENMRTGMNINANRRDALDRSTQVLSSLPNVSL